MNIESRGGSLPPKSSDEWRAQLRMRKNVGQNFSPQAAHIQQLQEKLSEAQQKLDQETRRAQLLEQELSHLRSLTLQNTRHQSASSSAANAQPDAGLHSPMAQIQQTLQPDTRPRSRSIDGKPSTVKYNPTEVHRAPSCPIQPAGSLRKAGNLDRAVSSALHAVSGAYLKQQAAQQSSRLQKRQQPMSDGESKAYRFIEQAQPVLLGGTPSTVTISKQAFELLVLKDRAINAVKEGITIADCSLPDHPLIFTNDAFSKITGYGREEVLGKNCRFLQGPGTDEVEIAKMREAANEGKPSVVQLLNYKKNGDPFINYLSITPIHDSRGHVTHFVGIQSDISDLVNHKKAELAAKHEAAQAAAATEVKSQFLARMSHEIRTPLNGMIAVGQLLAETVLTPAQWDLMNTIRCSGETLLTLITDILDFSRIEADKMVLSPSEFHLQTVIEAAMEIAGLHAAQKRLQVAYNVADNVPKLVICDAQRLQQVLLNVLNNAVKFTEKGEVLLEVWCEPQDERSPAQQEVAELQQDSSENASDSQDRADRPQALLGHVSKDSGQHVQVTGPALEAFRPLTPDNLSQHTELAEMRQQVQGLAPSFAQHAAGRCDALPLSFNMCSQGENCSCLPGKDDARSESLIAAVQQQTPGKAPSQHEEISHQQQQDTQHGLNPCDTFTAAPPSNTSAGQQHILATSSASANASIQANPTDASTSHQADRLGAPSSVAFDAAQEYSHIASRRRQAMDGCEERTQRRHDTHASTSGRSYEDASHYTLNFSVRDSGIGISDENLDNLFQCFCQVDTSPTRRFGGSGLGLAICKKLTEAMGGHMWVESDGLGKGSVFRWTLQAVGHNCMMPKRISSDKGASSVVEHLSNSSGTGSSISGSSRSSGPRQLQQNLSSADWRAGSGSMSGSTVESGLALFAGKKVLLVEFCDMVRQVLALALRRWGFQVCAVKSEPDATKKLSLRDGHSDLLAACKRRSEGKLSLQHSDTDMCDDSMYDADGPYDVVILDMALSQLVLAPMEVENTTGPAASEPFEQGAMNAASALVFLGWPGQNEPEDDALNAPLDSSLASPMPSQGSSCYQDALGLGPGAISAQMSPDTAEKMSNGPFGGKKLMYAIVTRPVRQGRLKLALEEVLSSRPDPSEPSTLPTPPDRAAAAASAFARASSCPGSPGQGAHPNQGVFQTALEQNQNALGHNENALGQGDAMQSRQDSQRSSGQMSIDGLSTSESLLPSPSELAPLRSMSSIAGSNLSSQGTDMEHALHTRRHSLHRAPKLRGHGSHSELGEVEGSRRYLKVLLAEDNLINMKVALGILKRTGYSEVTTVVDGQQAMDELHRRGGADAFDIILTDLHMPHKGGMEMVTEIRQLWPHSKVRVVAVTADAFEDRRDQCLATGFDGWLAKPFRVEDLVKIMKAVS